MPHVHLSGDVSLYHEFVGEFDQDRPTIVCLSPTMHSITLFGPMLAHPFWKGWNVLLIDLRFHGRSTSPKEDDYAVDFGVHAADVALALEKLELPACHFYCPEVSAFHTGIHLGVLFPEIVLSLSFAGVYSLFTPQDGATRVFEEIDSYIVDAETQEDYIDGIGGMLETCLGNLSAVSAPTLDRMAALHIKRHDPHTLGALAHHSAFRIPFLLSRSHVASIACPVLIIHGDDDIAHPVSAAQESFDALTGSGDRQILFIEGGPHCCDLTHEPIATARIVEFLTPYSSLPINKVPIKLDGRKVLGKLAEITGDRTILSRDASLARSYHSQSPATLLSQRAKFAEGTRRAQSYDGPIDTNVSQPWEARLPGEWRFSRRHEAVQAHASQRRSSAGLVEVHMDVATVNHKVED